MNQYRPRPSWVRGPSVCQAQILDIVQDLNFLILLGQCLNVLPGDTSS